MFRDASPLAEHQRSAVERLSEILDGCGGAILADEPGLGKSFVAAEIARRESRRGAVVDLVVPSSLVAQWRDTLARFEVEANLLTHASLRGAQEPCAGRRLMIVDEAHAFRNPRTQRFAALARRSVGARLLLVTATPVCNSAADLEALLRLIACDDALWPLGVPSIDAAFARRDHELLDTVVSALVVRRDKSVLPEPLAFGELHKRVLITPNGNDEVSGLIEALQLPLVAGGRLVRDFLRRRLGSSPAALLESLRRQTRFYERALECLASGRTLPKRDYRRAFGHEEDAEAFQTVLFWDLFVPEGAAVDPGEIHAELSRIRALREAVEELPRTKEETLVKTCTSTKEPILVFTGWAATARAICTALQPLRRTVLVTGRQRGNSESIDAFRRGTADVLVSTDVGAEGLNLQRAAVVIHYDLPWNPVRLDQRNGRAHRIGQRRPVVRAIYFLAEGRRDAHLQTVASKNRVRRRLLRHERSGPQGLTEVSTIRPRVTEEAAAFRLRAAAAEAGLSLPEGVERRHRAGLETLLAEIASAPLGEQSLRAIETLVAAERWGRPL